MEPASGNRSTQVFDSAGEVIATIDPLGDRTSYGYDLRGLQVTTTNPLGNVWTVALDAVGNAVAMTTPRGNTTTTTFDADNRPIAIIQPTGGGIATQIYDAVGNRTVSIDQLGNRTTTAFDAVNRPVSVTQPTGAVGTVVYDGVSNVLSTIDGMGEVTSYGFDALNRQVTTTDPLGNVTTTILDAVGQQTGLIDASGNRTTWAYDAAGNMISMTDSLNHTTTSTFDGANQLTSATERNGRRIDYGYDLAGNETTQKWYTSLGTLTQTNTFAYDAAGRETVAADPSGTYTLAYNAASQVTSVQEPFGLVLTMGYDTDGNRTSVQDSTGGIVTSIYDAMDRLSTRETVTSSGGLFTTGIRFDYAYNARGDVISLTRASLFGSVVDTTSFTYDSGDRLTNEKETGSSGSVLSNNTYTYDLADRMTSKTENGTTTSYSYDTASQLTQDGSATFGYDKTGNRTNAGDVTGTGNELSTDGTYTYTYDNNGNVTQQTQGASGPTWVYTYNNANELIGASYSATLGGTVTQMATYSYDAWGNRIESDDWNGTTTTVMRLGLDGWDTAKPQAIGNEGFDAWAVLNGSNTLQSRQLFGSGFAQPVACITAAGTVSWYLTDAEGSVRKVIDNSDTVLASATYSAYGALTGGSLADAYGYTGQRLDALTGLYSSGNGTRDYRPSTGTWMQSDPLYPLTGPNAHEYGNNSPTNETDPSAMGGLTLGGSITSDGGESDGLSSSNPLGSAGGVVFRFEDLLQQSWSTAPAATSATASSSTSTSADPEGGSTAAQRPTASLPTWFSDLKQYNRKLGTYIVTFKQLEAIFGDPKKNPALWNAIDRLSNLSGNPNVSYIDLACISIALKFNNPIGDLGNVIRISDAYAAINNSGSINGPTSGLPPKPPTPVIGTGGGSQGSWGGSSGGLSGPGSTSDNTTSQWRTSWQLLLTLMRWRLGYQTHYSPEAIKDLSRNGSQADFNRIAAIAQYLLPEVSPGSFGSFRDVSFWEYASLHAEFAALTAKVGQAHRQYLELRAATDNISNLSLIFPPLAAVEAGAEFIQGNPWAAGAALIGFVPGVKVLRWLRGSGKTVVPAAFTHQSQWIVPDAGSLMSKAWKEHYSETLGKFRDAGGKIVKSTEAPLNTAGKRIYGIYDPTTKTITLYKDFDKTTMFEELLHWQDVVKMMGKANLTEKQLLEIWQNPGMRDRMIREGEKRVHSEMMNFGFGIK